MSLKGGQWSFEGRVVSPEGARGSYLLERHGGGQGPWRPGLKPVRGLGPFWTTRLVLGSLLPVGHGKSVGGIKVEGKEIVRDHLAPTTSLRAPWGRAFRPHSAVDPLPDEGVWTSTGNLTIEAEAYGAQYI